MYSKLNPPQEKGGGRWKNVLKFGAVGAGIGLLGLLVGTPAAIAAGGLVGGAVGFWKG